MSSAETPSAADRNASPRLQVILFTDLVDSSALTVQLGDQDYFQYVLTPHNAIFRALLREFPGAREINPTGDGFMTTFSSASDAARFALQLHQRLRTAPWQRVTPLIRIGIHLGDLLEYTGPDGTSVNLTGDAANMTSRVMSLAAGGQTLLTKPAFDSARQSGRVTAPESDVPRELRWLAHGLFEFKGARDKPFEVCEVGVVGEAPLRRPPDSEKAKHVAGVLDGWRPAPGLPVPRREGWVLVNKLGEGGFGEVWLARHERTRGDRVFKFCFDADRLRSFKREAYFARLINEHLGKRDDIVPLADVQVDESPYFLESEYLPAGNLKQWADNHGGIQTFSLPFRVHLLAQVARAVAAAHSVGIIHKDIKPSNILIEEAPVAPGQPEPNVQPRLCDFGIGILTNPDLLKQHTVTDTAGILGGNDSSRTGTRIYAPPEALVDGPPTPAGDVYALGVMLYQCATGDLMRPMTSSWQEDVADELLREDILACTQREPTRRPGAAELAERLDALPRRAAEAEARRRAARLAQRYRQLRIALGVAIAALLIVGGLGLLSYVNWQRAEKLLYRNKVLFAHQVWRDYNPGPMKELLASAPAPLIDWEWHYLNGLAQQGARRTLLGHEGLVRAVAISPDDSLLASGGQDGSIKVWDIHDIAGAKELYSLTSPMAGPVYGLAFATRDGQLELAATSGDEVFIWDVAKKKVRLRCKGPAGPLRCLALHSNAGRIAAGGHDGAFWVWDSATGEPIHQLVKEERHAEPILSMAFNADGSRLATGSGDAERIPLPATPIGTGEIKVWDTKTWKRTWGRRKHTGPVFGLAFHPTNQHTLAAAYFDATTRIWEVQDEPAALKDEDKADEELTAVYHSVLSAYGVAFSPDGDRVASCSGDQTIVIGDAKDEEAIVNGREDLPLLVGHSGHVYSVAFSPVRDLLASASADGTVKIWDTKRHQGTIPFLGHRLAPTAVAFRSDGKRIASVSLDGNLCVWDPATGKDHTLMPHDGPLHAVAFSPNRRHVATGSGTGKVTIWDSIEKRVVSERQHKNAVLAVAYSPDGSRLAVAEGTSVRVHTGDKMQTLQHDGPVHAVAFHPGGKAVATAGADGVRVWHVDGGEKWRVPHDDPVLCLAYAPDGSRLASAGIDKKISIWNASSGREIMSIAERHSEPILSLAFNPRATRLASGSRDSTLRVWDTVSGDLVFTGYHSFDVYCVAFSPDGLRLASASCYPDKTDKGDLRGAGMVKIWDATPGFTAGGNQSR